MTNNKPNSCIFSHFVGHILPILQAGGHENTLSGRQRDMIVYSCTQYGHPWRGVPFNIYESSKNLEASYLYMFLVVVVLRCIPDLYPGSQNSQGAEMSGLVVCVRSALGLFGHSGQWTKAE